MSTKTASRNENAIQNRQQVSVEIDENGVAIVNSEEEGDEIEDVVYTESLCSPKKMLLGIKEDTHFS